MISKDLDPDEAHSMQETQSLYGSAPTPPITLNIKRSSATKYQKALASMREKYVAEHHDEPFTWLSFVNWVIITSEKKNHSKNYCGVIRAAIIFALSDLEDEDSQSALILARKWLHEIPYHGQTEVTNRRSRPSRRMIPKEDWQQLIDHFNTKMQSVWSARAQAMIGAGVGCGARPIEWINAELVSKNVLRIYTAKVKNKSAWGKITPGIFTEADLDNSKSRVIAEYGLHEEENIESVLFEDRVRHCGLDFMEDADLIKELRENRCGTENRIFRDVVFDEKYTLPIQMNLRYIDDYFREKFGDKWRDMDFSALSDVYAKDYYSKVRIAVWRACKAIFPDGRLYSPADTRSTFSANRKAKIGLERTAADMGHSHSSVTRGHYANAKMAWIDE